MLALFPGAMVLARKDKGPARGLVGPRSVHDFFNTTRDEADRGQKVNHAGFDREVLARNPRRFNEYGDELDDSESDAEADADAEEENPYAEVKLEGTFMQATWRWAANS